MDKTKQQIKALTERLKVTIEHLQASGIRSDAQQPRTSKQAPLATNDSSLDYDHMRRHGAEGGPQRQQQYNALHGASGRGATPGWDYAQDGCQGQALTRYAGDAEYGEHSQATEGYEQVTQDEYYHNQEDLDYGRRNGQRSSGRNVGSESRYSQLSGKPRDENRALPYRDREQGGHTEPLSQLDGERRRNESPQTTSRFSSDLNRGTDEYGQLKQRGGNNDRDRYQRDRETQLGSNVYQGNSDMISYGTDNVMRSRENDKGFDIATKRDHYSGHSDGWDTVNRDLPVVIDYNHATQSEGKSGSKVSQERGQSSTAASKDHLSSEYEEYMKEIGLHHEDTGKETTHSRMDQSKANTDNGRSRSGMDRTNMHGSVSESFDRMRERNLESSHQRNSRERNQRNDIDRSFPNKRDRQTFNDVENSGANSVEDRSVKRQRKSRFSDLKDSDTASKADSTSSNGSKVVTGQSSIQHASTSRQGDRLMGQQRGIDSIRTGMEEGRVPRQDRAKIKPPSQFPQQTTDTRRGDNRGRPGLGTAPIRDHGPYGGDSQGDGLLPLPTCPPRQPPARCLNQQPRDGRPGDGRPRDQRLRDQGDGLLPMPSMGPGLSERDTFEQHTKDRESRLPVRDFPHGKPFQRDVQGAPSDDSHDLGDHLLPAPQLPRLPPGGATPNANRKTGSGLSREEGRKGPRRKSRFADLDDVTEMVTDHGPSLRKLHPNGGKDRLGSHDVGKDILGPHDVGRDRLGPHEVGRDRLGPHNVGRDRLGPHDVGRDRLGPHEVGRDRLGSHDVGRDRLGPHEVGRDRLGPHDVERDRLGPHNVGRDRLGPHEVGRDRLGSHDVGRDRLGPHEVGRDRLGPHDVGRDILGPHDMGRDRLGPHDVGRDKLGPHDVRRDRLPHNVGRNRLGPHEVGRDRLGPHNVGRDRLGSHDVGRDRLGSHEVGRDRLGPHEVGRDRLGPHDVGRDRLGPHDVGRDRLGPHEAERNRLGPHEAGRNRLRPHDEGRYQMSRDEDYQERRRNDMDLPDPSREEIDSLLRKAGQIVSHDRHLKDKRVKGHQAAPSIPSLLDLPLPADRPAGVRGSDEDEDEQELRAVMEEARLKLGYVPDSRVQKYQQHDDLLATPRQDGLLAPPRQDGLLAPPRQDGLLAPPRQDGLLAPPRQDGLLALPRGKDYRQDGLLATPRQDGLLATPRQDGLLAPPRQDGLLAPPRQDGLLATPRGRDYRQDGLLVTSRLDGLVAEPEVALDRVWMDGNPCPIAECLGIEFESFLAFRAHWQSIHTTRESVHQCSVCDAVFWHYRDAMKHMLLHPRPGRIVEITGRPPKIHPGDVLPYLPPTDLLPTQETMPYQGLDEHYDNPSTLPEFDRKVKVEGKFDAQSDYKLKFIESEELAFKSLDDDDSQFPLFETGKVCPVGAKECKERKFDTFSSFDKHWKKYHVTPIWLFHCTACSAKFRQYYRAKEHPKERHGGQCMIWSEKVANKFFIDPGNVLRRYRKQPPPRMEIE